MKTALVVAWHNPKQIAEFKDAWKITGNAPHIFLTQDIDKSGCAATKNRGIAGAYGAGYEIICVLDDDCYPKDPHYTLTNFFEDHEKALEPQDVRMVFPPTHPPPRGMPYRNQTIKMQVAASIGLWLKYPDLDAMSALVLGDQPELGFAQIPMYGRYFPFCGMNFAFRREWIDCAKLINVPRFDDIWMGWVWEKIAYAKGYCFNLNGPMVNHMRQSNMWENLQQEVKYLKVNEDLWSSVYLASNALSVEELRALFGLSVSVPVALAL